MPDVRRADPLQRPRVGLLAAASVIEPNSGLPSGEPEGGRWGQGITWRPERPPITGDAFGARELSCITASLPVVTQPTNETAYPFMVFARDSCSTFNDADLANTDADREARARRMLDATRSYSVAKEFWSGAISTAQGLGNTWLKKATATSVTSGAIAPAKALAKLDQLIMQNLTNGQGMIHCDPECLELLKAAYAIDQQGTVWMTANGNKVVADGGYDGSGSVAGTWMFATTPVTVVFGPVLVYGDPNATVTRSTNDRQTWAQQDAIVLHEPHLVWHRAQVDLTL